MKEKAKVVMITGASAGVGRATVRAFAQRGACVGLIARGTDGLEAARADVEKLGGKALIFPVDVADAEKVEEAAARVEEEFGPIDIWVNNAMVSVFSPVKELTAEEVHRVTEVSYLGVVYGTLAALKRMLPREACDPGIHRVASLRAAPRPQRRARVDGAVAGDEHAAIRLGEEPAPAR